MMKSTIKVLLFVSLVWTALPSCKKKKDEPTPTPPANNTPTTPAGPSLNSDPLVQFEINTVASSYVEGSNISNDMGSSRSVGTPTSSASFDSGFSQTTPYKSIFDIDKGTIVHQTVGGLDSTTFKNYFAPAAYAFSPVTSTTTSVPINGIVITWWDASNVKWTSDMGTGDQTGSNFTIVASKQEWVLGDQHMKVYATFNCKLYDGNGNSKTLTNGKFVGYFGNI